MKQPSERSSANVIVRSIAFTAAALDALEELASAIAARSGRKASVSAVVRALLRHAQETPNVMEKLAGLVEQEQARDVVWGKPRQSPR